MVPPATHTHASTTRHAAGRGGPLATDRIPDSNQDTRQKLRRTLAKLTIDSSPRKQTFAKTNVVDAKTTLLRQ